MRSRNSERYWTSHFEKWRDSGLSQAEYCRQQKLKWHSFHYWRKKIELEKKADGVRLVAMRSEFRMTSETRTNAPLKVRLEEYELEIPAGFDLVTLRGVIGVLRNG